MLKGRTGGREEGKLTKTVTKTVKGEREEKRNGRKESPQ
jgi:hypothetical protein